MADWSVQLVNFALNTTYTATLTMTDHGNGTASGELNNLSGPVPTETIDLNGSITGSTFVLGGSNEALNIDLDVTFKPFVDGFVGSARIERRRVLVDSFRGRRRGVRVRVGRRVRCEIACRRWVWPRCGRPGCAAKR